jgi:hypothetical protein
MWKKAFLFSVSMALPACLVNSVAKLNPEAKKVQIVHESDRPLSCKVLGKINGTSHAGDEKKARKGAENDFRNHAADLKANFALVEVERSGALGGTSSQREVFLGGKALFCRTEEMEEAEEKAQEEAQRKKEEEEQKAQEEKERKEQEAKEKKEQEEEEKKNKRD